MLNINLLGIRTNSTIYSAAKIFQDYGSLGLPVLADKYVFQGNLGNKINEYLALAGNVCLTEVMTKTMLNLTTANIVRVMKFDSDLFTHHAYGLAFDEDMVHGPNNTELQFYKLNTDKLKETALKIAAACAIKFFFTDSTEKEAHDVTIINNFNGGVIQIGNMAVAVAVSETKTENNYSDTFNGEVFHMIGDSDLTVAHIV